MSKFPDDDADGNYTKKRKQSFVSRSRNTSSRQTHQGTLTSSTPISPPRKKVLRSAFLAPTVKRSRNPPTIEYSFNRTSVNFDDKGRAKFIVSDNVEYISIASDWLEGEELFKLKQPYDKTGFIGRGFTKRGIYVSVNLYHCYEILADILIGSVRQ